VQLISSQPISPQLRCKVKNFEMYHENKFVCATGEEKGKKRDAFSYFAVVITIKNKTKQNKTKQNKKQKRKEWR
jgi:hypothetical protein